MSTSGIADDPLPRRRAARRMLRRLDGMGKYGGYHTEFRHLARGFAGHERQLALEVGEALLRAGYLAEKPSVGQRHVSLVAARTSDIRALIERGTCDEPLRSLLVCAFGREAKCHRKRDWPRSFSAPRPVRSMVPRRDRKCDF